MEDKMIERITDYFDGVLSETERIDFEAALKDSDVLAKEVEAYRQLLKTIGEEEKLVPSKNLEDNFMKMLAEEKAHQAKVVDITPNRKNWMSGFLKVAASITVLISIFYLGRYSQQKEAQSRIELAQKESVAAKQMAALAMMENQSANKRIQAVNYVEEISAPDDDIINALADRLRYDENTNVRMVALEALSNYPQSKIVKNLFLDLLKEEKNPSIQIALIQQLVNFQEKKAIAPLKELLENEETQPFIKAEINQALPKII